MKAFLMYPNRDFDPKAELPANGDALIQDLELGTILNTMAQGDDFLLGIATIAMLASERDLPVIHYRQAVLRDCLRHPDVVRGIYDVAVEAFGYKKRHWRAPFDYIGGTLSRAIELIEALTKYLGHLRGVADASGRQFESEGFKAFFAMLRHELDDQFFADVKSYLDGLKFRNGTDISARLGAGNRGTCYVLRKPPDRPESWLGRLLNEEPSEWVDSLFKERPPSFIYRLHPRDEAGARALSELRDIGLQQVANALDESVTHILSFFEMLRNELGFYVGALNLADDLHAKGAVFALPEPAPLGERRFDCHGLYDLSLALTLGRKISGNDIEADEKSLFVVTGANQGGKSTFLRSVGQAQLMMQAGMFVAAEALAADVADGLFTHFKREEDTGMKSGKLDEELGRMSEIIDLIHPNSLWLSNESFAATNEREGSEIARQIVGALLERKVKIVLVTHLYDLAHGLSANRTDEMFFLRAERRETGERTFRLIEAEPLETSYGEDLYRQIFTEDVKPEPALAAQ
jgi:MutS domain V